MKVSFIIPLYNCLPLTRAMLASLRATVPGEPEHEIILVDDGSSDGTREWLASLDAPCRVLLNERNLGFARTCNRGAEVASGDLLLFLNNDLELLPGWLAPMLGLFTRHPDTAVVGNVQLSYASGAVDHAGIFFNHKGKPEHLTRRGWRRQRAVAAVTGACLAVRRETWQRLGGFDERYVNGCEDVDLCLRARAAGGSVRVALRSVVRHHVSAAAGRKLRDEQNTARLARRWEDAIPGLAARDWSRQFIQDHWDRSFVFDYPLAWQAVGCWLGVLRPVPAGIRDGVRASLAVEFQRWARLQAG